MLRWRRLAPSLHALRQRYDVMSTTEIGSSKIFAQIPARMRLFSTRNWRESAAVTPQDFIHYLRNVGLSKEALPSLYQRKHSSSHGASPDHWVAPAPQSYPLAVALSGGGDSMALMLLLQEFLDSHNVETPLLAITVDHQLRPESGDEARNVGEIASTKWGVHHVIKMCDWKKEDDQRRSVAAPRKSKLQEVARSYRYKLLAEACVQHGVKCLFVAHNLGDQLETVLFRLGRASGINGLAGMAARTTLVDDGNGEESVVIVRPLLDVSKTSLKLTCERFHQPWIEDPSNESLVYDRIRIRKALKLVNEDDVEALKTFQRMAAAAKKEFTTLETELLESHMLHSEPHYVVISCAILSDPRSFDELVIRVLSNLVREIGGKDTPPRLSSVELLLRDLRSLGSGKKVTLSGCCITKMQRASELHFFPERAGARRSRKPSW